MPTTRHPRALAALAAASALTLSACGGDAPTSEDTSTTSTTSSAETSSAPSESASPSESAEPSTSESAAGSATVTAPKSGLTFAAPEGWKTIDPQELASNTDDAPEEIVTMAQSAGMPVDEFLQNLAQAVDVMVMGEAEDGFAQNINVVAIPQKVDEAMLKSNLESQQAEVATTDQVDTDLGKTPVATYTMSVNGQTVHGTMIGAPSGSGSGIITVTTLDADDTASIADTVLESVATGS